MNTSDKKLRVLLVGATGAVGQAVLAQALTDVRVQEVVALTRKSLPAAPKLVNAVVDFTALPAAADWWVVDLVICTLGTTIKVAGSKEKFVAVDRDLPIQIARRALAAGASRFALNSSMGANSKASNFYLRTKGEAEAGIRALGYPSLTIVRPALIDAKRTETRRGESLALGLMRPLRFVIPAGWRPVTPEAIARALLAGGLASAPSSQIIESGQLA